MCLRRSGSSCSACITTPPKIRRSGDSTSTSVVSAEAMYDSIRRLYQLPDETRVFVGHDYLPEGREVRFQTTIGASKHHNPQLNAATTREAFVTMRKQRDASLAAPRLLFQSVQINIDAGRLPEPHPNGVRYFRVPLNLFQPADALGRPNPKA